MATSLLYNYIYHYSITLQVRSQLPVPIQFNGPISLPQ